MEDSKQLTVIEQRDVAFYGDELTAVRADDGHVYVSVRHLCQALDLDRTAQVRRIRRHDILDEGYKGGAILASPSKSGVGGGEQQAGLLRVDLIPLWLSGLRASMVREEIRPKIKQFQREAARVLWEAFRSGELSVDHDFSDLLQQDESPSVQAYKMLAALTRMAKQQILIENRLNEQGLAITHNTMTLGDLAQRMESLEADIGRDDRLIASSQAVQIAQAVKAIALELGKRSRRNEFGGVYGELHRRFEIPEYRLLAAHRFDEAMTFLRDWYGTITDDDQVVPF